MHKFFSNTHNILIKVDNIRVMIQISMDSKIEIVISMFSEHKGIKLEINHIKILVKL